MKSMKKALSLFLALSMLMTVCAVNILAEDTVTLTVPNGNFANVTVPLTEGGSNENGTLPDGWILKKYSINAEEPSENRLCYSIGTYLDGTIKTSPTSDRGPEDGSKSLMIKNMAGNFLVFESPKIPLKGALTENAEFTVAFDYWLSKGNYKAAIFFYNTEGQVYKGRETGWGAEVISPKAHTDLEYQDAKGNNSYVNEARAAAGWQTKSFTAVAPEGTSSVSIGLFAVNNSAVRYFYDNVKLSYKSFSAMSGPQAVTNLKASAGDKQVTLSWELPADTTNYAGVKIAVKNGATPVKEVFVEDAAKTSETIPQLENGVDYTFEVYAMNADKSKFSEPVSVNATPAAPATGVVEIPNWNFENTVNENQPLTDGWSYQLYVNPNDALGSGMLYYAIYAKSGNGKSASGSNSLEMKCPGTSGGYNKTAIIVKSPTVSLAEALTAEHQFTYDFDYKCIAGNFNTAILFHNAEGKVYNGTEWIDFAVNKDEDWKFTDSSGQNGYSTIGITAANKQWSSSQIMTNAPAGTTGVSVIVIATGSGANKFAIDNLKITYVPAPEEKPVPKTVTELTAAAGDGQVSLSWVKPQNDSNYAGVRVTVKNGAETVKTVDFVGLDIQNGVVDGLTNGTEYTFEVASMNGDKTLFSDPVSVTSMPFAQGQIADITVKNSISDRTIYADDYEMTVDLAVTPLRVGEEQQGLFDAFAASVNVFNADAEKVVFSSDTPGVSFRETVYEPYIEKQWILVNKKQLVYKPSQASDTPVNIEVKAQIHNGENVIAEGTTSFAVTVNPVPADEWKPADTESTVYLTVPNGNFDRMATTNSWADNFNKDIPGGWHAFAFGATGEGAVAHLGDDRVGYNVFAKNGSSLIGVSGQGMDFKGGIGTATDGDMIIESGKIAVNDTKSKNYRMDFQYKGGRGGGKPAAVMFFYNEEGALYLGEEAGWKLNPTPAEMWNAKDAAGSNLHELYAPVTQFTSAYLERTAPEGTKYVTVGFAATGGTAFRAQVDNVSLSYMLKEVIRPVTDLTSVSGDGQVTLQWKKPMNSKLYAGVRVTVKNGASVVKTVDVEGADKETATITGLTNNVNYTFEVQSMTADKTELAEAVIVNEIPHVAGVLPVKNQIKDRTIYSDDYEMTVDLNILDEGTTSMSDAQKAYFDFVVNGVNVFESKGKKLNFTSETPGVSFREMKYGVGLDAAGSKAANAIKQQLVYKPSQVTEQPVIIDVTADDGAGSTGTVTFRVSVIAPPESEKPLENPNSDIVQMYVPNGNFDRRAEQLPYNGDLSGGWHPLLWGSASGRLGDNQLSYVGAAGKEGNALDLKAPSGGGTSLMIQSAFLKTPDTQERAYTLSLVYKCANSVQRPNFSLFFFNEKKEGFIGFDPDGAAIWKADPTPADLWASVDAEGKAPYENAGSTNGFQQFSLTRTAPEGTAYVMIGLNATFGSAYRYQVDNIRLSYLKNKAPVINGENPLSRTLSLGEALRLDLNGIFSEPDGETMTFTAETGKGVIENGVYTYIPNKIGEETVLVTAADEQGAKARLRIAVTVKDATSVSVPNKDIKPVTRETVQGSMELKKADGSNVTSLSQLNAGEILKINLSLKNTSELPVTTTLLIVKYDANGVVESVTTKGIVIPSTGGEPDYTTVRDYVVENNSGSVEVMLWDSATNLNSLIDPIRI